MTVHKEGYTSIALCILFIAVLNAVIQFYMPEAHGLQWFVYMFSFLLLLTTLLFYRSPSVKISAGVSQVFSPVDGSVIAVAETAETEYLKERCMQISIVTSLVNAHVTRSPVSGVIKHFGYQPGISGGTTVVIENSAGVRILLRQIAGALSRRGVWYINGAEEVHQGAQLGFTKFGSESDIFVPIGAMVKVAVGEKVKGGRTVLAELTGEVSKEKNSIKGVKES